MLKKRSIWIGVILAVTLVIGGAYVYFTAQTARAQSADTSSAVQTAPVRQGDILISATGAGTVIAATEVVAGFPSGGTLDSLLVQVGDQVAAGDLLAQLDDTAAQETLAQAELQLAQAVMRTDGTQTAAGVSYNDLLLEQARTNLEQAQQNLADLQSWEPDEDEIAKAEATLAAAQAGFNAALGQEASAGYNLQITALSLEQAQQAVVDAQANYDEAWDEARDWETFWDEPTCRTGETANCTGTTWSDRIESDRNSTAAALERAQDNLTIAQAQYNAGASGTNSSSSANAESNVLSAELALKAAQTGPTEDDLEAAELAVRQAEIALLQAQLNQEADTIGLAQAELNVQNAQQNLTDAQLFSPISGTVMAVAANEGEVVGGGALITLADLDQPLLEIYLDETDLDKIGLDYEVEVVLDALPDDTFIGRVVQIDPQLQTVSGVTVVRALVELDQDSFAKPQSLPVGMNATVDVIGGRADNALLVPVEALREISPGEYAVFVLENDVPELRFVEVGLQNFTFAEIISGLAMGDVVTTGIVETE